MPAGWEWVILVLIALLLFGGSRLPGVGPDVRPVPPAVPDQTPPPSSDVGANGNFEAGHPELEAGFSPAPASGPDRS